MSSLWLITARADPQTSLSNKDDDDHAQMKKKQTRVMLYSAQQPCFQHQKYYKTQVIREGRSDPRIHLRKCCLQQEICISTHTTWIVTHCTIQFTLCSRQCLTFCFISSNVDKIREAASGHFEQMSNTMKIFSRIPKYALNNTKFYEDMILYITL